MPKGTSARGIEPATFRVTGPMHLTARLPATPVSVGRAVDVVLDNSTVKILSCFKQVCLCVDQRLMNGVSGAVKFLNQ